MRGSFAIPNSRIRKTKIFCGDTRAVSAKRDEGPRCKFTEGRECTVAFPGFQRDKSNTVFFTRRTADRRWADTARIFHSFAVARIINHVQYEQAKRDTH